MPLCLEPSKSTFRENDSCPNLGSFYKLKRQLVLNVSSQSHSSPSLLLKKLLMASLLAHQQLPQPISRRLSGTDGWEFQQGVGGRLQCCDSLLWQISCVGKSRFPYVSLTHNETHLYFISHGIKFLGQSFGLIHRKRSAAGVLTTSHLSLIATPFPLPATSKINF